MHRQVHSVARVATTVSARLAAMISLFANDVTRVRRGIFDTAERSQRSGDTAKGGNMNRRNTIPVGIASLSLFIFVLFGIVRGQGEVQPSDPAAYYKAKCVACHGPKAEKKFDPALTDEQYIDAILKGKKPEKPPNMPAYGEKGVTSEQAKALLDHMKQLRSAQ